MRRVLFIYLLALLAVTAEAQKTGYLELVKAERELEQLFNRLYSDTVTAPDPILDSILPLMEETLTIEGSMDYPWNRLNRIGRISSDDEQIRIFTWHVMDDPDNYRYFGFVQIGQRRGKVKVFELRDNGKPQRDLRNLEQSTDNWYGKLYYGIITTQYRRKTYYTLLGMDFNSSHSVIKTIESISIQRQEPDFTRELFFDGKEIMDRVVLEYSSQVSISVRFDPGLDMITHDHLEPFHPIYSSSYEFYGPTGSYDGLQFTDGIWMLHEDVDARNKD